MDGPQACTINALRITVHFVHFEIIHTQLLP